MMFDNIPRKELWMMLIIMVIIIIAAYLIIPWLNSW